MAFDAGTVALALLLAAPPAPPVTGGGDVADRLAELSSPSSAERLRAERWLTVHVGREHYPILAEAALAGDAEVRQRLGRIVGAEASRLDLALLFALAEDETLSTLGEEAAGEIVSLWSRRYRRPGLVGEPLARALEGSLEHARPEHLRVDLAAPLETTVDRLARLTGVPMALCVEPGVGGRARRRLQDGEAPFVGTWNRVVLALAGAHRVGIEGIALAADEPTPGAILRFTPPGDEGIDPGWRILVRWCVEAAGGETPERRSAAARALAASGWPAALGWLERRWLADDDRAALDGLLVAAARGRRVRSLGRTDTLRRLLDEARQAARRISSRGIPGEADDLLLHRLLQALAFGGPVGAAGGDLARTVLSSFDGAVPLERELLLAVLEGTGAHGASQEGVALLRTILGAPPGAHPAPVLRQALRAWVAVAPAVPGRVEPPALGDPVGLLVGEPRRRSHQGQSELPRLLLVAGARPPEELRGTKELGALGLPPGEVAARIALFEWWLGSGDVEAAAHHLLGLVETPGPVGSALADWVARGDRGPALAVVSAGRELARGEAAAGAVDRVALFAGLLAPGEHGRLLEQARADPGDPALLGALAGWPRTEAGQAARQDLLDRLRAGLAVRASIRDLGPLTAALERALLDLLARGGDTVARGLHAAVSQLLWRASGGGDSPVVRWPPIRRIRDLEGLDRRLLLSHP